MNESELIDLLYGGMDQLGPGSDRDTLTVLEMLPRKSFATVVDAGCGTGRQSLVLARQLGTVVHAVDNHAPFLTRLEERARAAGVDHLVRPRCLDMAAIPDAFPKIDLLWSEGAANSIGFTHALERWREALAPDGLLVVSELTWLKDQAPADVEQFFRAEYPDMRTVDEILKVIGEAGYDLFGSHPLPHDAWVDGYYAVLEPRAQALLDHPEPSARALAAGTLEEIRVFGIAEDSYGYTFFVLQKR